MTQKQRGRLPHSPIELSAADNGTFVTIPLVPDVAAAVNDLLGSGRISLGGRIKTFEGTHIDELLFAFTDLELPHIAGKSASTRSSTNSSRIKRNLVPAASRSERGRRSVRICIEFLRNFSA